MKVGVREYLEGLGHKVGYDKNTGDVLVQSGGGMKSIGSDGFTLGEDGRYYASNEKDILNALKKNKIDYAVGYSPIRNTLSQGNAVGYNESTGQVKINGRDYNVDGKKLFRVGDEIYGSNEFLRDVEKDDFEYKYDRQGKKLIDSLLKDSYEGYDPEEDESYQMAYDAFIKSAKADMGKRGMTSDSLAAYYAAQGAEKLMPEYAKLHYEKYRDEKGDTLDAAKYLMELDEMYREAYEQNRRDYMNTLDIQQEQDKFSHQKKTDDINAAIKKSELLGYVPYDSAEILNAPAGAQIYEAAEREKERKHEKEENEKEFENEKELEEIKSQNRREESQMDYFMEQEIMKLQNDLDISKAEAQAYYKAIYR